MIPFHSIRRATVGNTDDTEEILHPQGCSKILTRRWSLVLYNLGIRVAAASFTMKKDSKFNKIASQTDVEDVHEGFNHMAYSLFH